jgi:hypothetical protein
MTKSLDFARRVGALVTLTGATVAQAAGDSGTSSVGEMQVSGGQFMMLLGGLVGLGVVVWLVVKAMNR